MSYGYESFFLYVKNVTTMPVIYFFILFSLCDTKIRNFIEKI